MRMCWRRGPWQRTDAACLGRVAVRPFAPLLVLCRAIGPSGRCWAAACDAACNGGGAGAAVFMAQAGLASRRDAGRAHAPGVRGGGLPTGDRRGRGGDSQRTTEHSDALEAPPPPAER